MAELADALDLGSSAFRRAGSIPVTRTNLINQAHVELTRELFFDFFRLKNVRCLQVHSAFFGVLLLIVAFSASMKDFGKIANDKTN